MTRKKPIFSITTFLLGTKFLHSLCSSRLNQAKVILACEIECFYFYQILLLIGVTKFIEVKKAS